MNLFCGGKFSDRVSSEKLLAVSAAGPPAAFFPEIDISGFFGHAHFGKVCISLYLVTFSKMAPQAKPLCPLDSYRNSVQNPGLNVSKAFTRTRFHKGKLRIWFAGLNVDLNDCLQGCPAMRNSFSPA